MMNSNWLWYSFFFGPCLSKWRTIRKFQNSLTGWYFYFQLLEKKIVEFQYRSLKPVAKAEVIVRVGVEWAALSAHVSAVWPIAIATWQCVCATVSSWCVWRRLEKNVLCMVIRSVAGVEGNRGLQMREVQATCTPRPLRKGAVPKMESGLSARKPSDWVGPSSALVGADPTRPTHSCFKH